MNLNLVAVSLSSVAADNVESERPLLALILHCSQPAASRDAVCPDACRRWPQYCYYAVAAENGVPGTCKLPPYPHLGDYSIETIELPRAGDLADFTLHYTCPPGYKLNGYHSSCIRGTWNTDFPSCSSVSLSPAEADHVESESSKCVLPPYPEHGSYSLVGSAGARPGSTLDAARLTVTCDPPYRPDGPAEVLCYNGQWNMPVPQCVRTLSLSPAEADHVESESSKCVLPPYPEHGSYSLVGRAGARPGLTLDAASLSVTCDPPYRPDGPAVVHCYNGQWYTPVPQCVLGQAPGYQKYREFPGFLAKPGFCKLTPHPSVIYSCKPTDPNVISGDRKCNDFEPSGTEVHPRCNNNYYHKGVLSYMYCIDGSWDNVVTCQPECGKLTTHAEPLVNNGVSAQRGEFPWHAGIYDKRYTPFMQICGGSLVSTTVVISAAHCFWNDLVHVLPAKYFAVGVGKIYRPWTIDEGGQKSDVSDLKVPLRFLGAINNFQCDIALVILVTPIILGNYVRPICIDFDVLSDEKQLQTGNVGKVAGWGLTSQDGNASPVLKVMELSYVDVEQCIADLPSDFRSFVTSDKICAGSKTGSALCKGDSGGGLVFPSLDRGVQRWYLRGVVSTAPSNEHQCNVNSYTLFTQLLKHDFFVRNYLSNFIESFEIR